tara:strand:- start:763 stop:1530 length:768 start_codon:yes stop_codon:yes gene_type:complete
METPTTSCAVANMVIMSNQLTKAEMHEQLAQILAERGINPRRTKIGRDIVCRVGDPTNVNDLIRVGAHKASAILVMMSKMDQVEEKESEGTIHNGATLRVVLALRHVLFTNSYTAAKGNGLNPDLRIVLQMSNPSEYVDAACFTHDNGNPAVIPVDLTKFSNALMFNCAAQPGLSAILLDLLDFEGPAIRRRIARNLRSGKFIFVSIWAIRLTSCFVYRPVQLEGRVHREDVRGDAAAVLHRDIHRDHPARDVGG